MQICLFMLLSCCNKCVPKMYREVESPEWFLLCLELGNPSSVSLPAVPMCYCCEKKKLSQGGYRCSV